jgi:hypothetical protein
VERAGFLVGARVYRALAGEDFFSRKWRGMSFAQKVSRKAPFLLHLVFVGDF